jgi:predicted CoA-binding protein
MTAVVGAFTFHGMKQPENVAILGASPKPDRYAYKAFELLREYGHQPIPINPAFAEILGEKCYPSISDAPKPIDTVTLYLGEARSNPLVNEIVAAKPRRIIMNPGAENAALAQTAEAAGIEVVEGCTLVMLRTGSF